MLKQKSIRSKLVVALALLSAIVLLLASSGFWGLHRYRRLARAIGHRAMEFELAHQLHQSATELQATRRRMLKYHDHQRTGMIDSTSLQDPLFDATGMEHSAYGVTLVWFGDQLRRYREKVEALESEDEVLIDTVKQLKSLERISNVSVALDETSHSLPNDVPSLHAELDRRHQDLVDETSRHLESIRDAMEQFSDDVRGQCNVWIVVAYTCTIAAFLMMGILIAAFRSVVVKPFSTLVDGSRLVAGGQFDHRIDLGTGDELSELAEAMNAMTDRFQGALARVKSWCTDLDRQVRERTREVIQNEQLASVGFLAAGVAHEINNPLASIAWSSESLQSRAAELTMHDGNGRVLDDEFYEVLLTNLRRIEDEAYRCKGITEKLLDFSRLSEVQRAPTDLVELANDVVSMVGKVGKYRCKTIRTHSSDPVTALVNPQEIRQVVLNLVTNALESVACDGAVDVYVAATDEHAMIAVADNGCGMTNEVLKHLFEPFFTRRRDGTGTGLGLSITYRIVSQHGGSLIAQSEGEGRGSRLEMHLPLATESPNTTFLSTGVVFHEPYQTN